ncbi:MAG: hypothetical protein ACOCYP_03615 [Planctomycetota bacterium]
MLTPDPPVLCFFHRGCLDGRAAAATVRRAHPKARCIPCQYGDRAPAVLGARVYVVDFAFDPQTMRRLEREAASICWIDHHRTHRATHAELGWGLFAEDECAAMLTWHALFPDESPPAVLKHIRARDLWRWEHPDSRAVVAALDDLTNDEHPEEIFAHDCGDLRRHGAPIVRRTDRRVRRIARRGMRISEPYGLHGVSALAVNSATHISEVGELVYTGAEDGGLGLDLAIVFFMRPDGRWVHSLRSYRVDCERIAANRGGGGHPAAACYVADEPFPASADNLGGPTGD